MADGFKTMVKMMTDEPSVINKAKRNVKTTTVSDADKGGGYHMYKKGGTVKKAAGGAMGAMEDSAKMRMAVKGMAKKQKPMGGRPMPAGNPTSGLGIAAASPPMASNIPAMKKGGKMDMAQDKAMIKKAMKQHDSQQHGKGTDLKLRKGGKAAYATGGVVMGQAGYKDGGGVGVRKGNAGGYKDGGSTAAMTKTTISSSKTGKFANTDMETTGKKRFATGGEVKSGAPVVMPQGKKKPNPPVAISKLSGTY
jgi:hypothetical protein